MTGKEQEWKPPTPESLLVPIHPHGSTNDEPTDDFQLHPVATPLTHASSNPHHDQETTRLTPAQLVGESVATATGTSANEPVLGLFSSHTERRASSSKISNDGGPLQEVTADDLLIAPVPVRKRPRREASARALAIRHPSPFELSGDEHVPSPTPSDDDDDDDSEKGFWRGGRTASGTGGAARGAGGKDGKTSRRISHSLIERRRREKINDCLETLRHKVPQCKELVEQKEAKAKERNRKRVDKPGLHKLEILQGTLEYIEDLERRLAQAVAVPPVKTRHYEAPLVARPFSTAVVVASSAARPSVAAADAATRSAAPALGVEEDLAARALLTISTSPELRPVL